MDDCKGRFADLRARIPSLDSYLAWIELLEDELRFLNSLGMAPTCEGVVCRRLVSSNAIHDWAPPTGMDHGVQVADAFSSAS